MTKFLRTAILALVLSPLAVWAAEPINLNTATADDLTALNGVGPAKAEAIIEYRTANGDFRSVDEIVNVPGIGEKSLEKWRDQLTVGNEASRPAANPSADRQGE